MLLTGEGRVPKDGPLCIYYICRQHPFSGNCYFVPQSCLILCDPMGCSLPGSSVHEILQARILAWVTMPFFRGSAWPRDQTNISNVSCIGRWVLYH